MPIFYQHPYELDKEERVQRLYKKMWFTGIGILEFIYKKLRLGKGQYPLDSIMATAKSKTQRRQLERVLTQFDLFIIENGMVSLRPGLNTNDFIRRDSISKKAQRAAELTQKDYSDELFPEAAKAMDQEAAEKLNDEIRKQVMEAFAPKAPQPPKGELENSHSS